MKTTQKVRKKTKEVFTHEVKSTGRCVKAAHISRVQGAGFGGTTPVTQYPKVER